MFIDADAHIEECTDTWSYFPKSLEDLRPGEMTFMEGEEPNYLTKRTKAPTHCFFIDGRVYQRRMKSDELTQTTRAARELRDVQTRINHMDKLGVGVQILYPGTLLAEVTDRPELEIAICESYNRWLADRCGESGGRLRWNASLPLRSIPDALREMKRAKAAGAVGIYKRAFECDRRPLGDDYFFPIYAQAQEVDLPICVHVSTPYSGTSPQLTMTDPGIRHVYYVQDAFLSVLTRGVCAKFPNLRFVFVEAASTWLHYAMWVMREDALSTNQQDFLRKNPQARALGDALVAPQNMIMEGNRLFVTCEATEDLPTLISAVGDNNFIVGTDYGHSDRSSILNAHQKILERGDLSESTCEKLVRLNAQRLYDLS